MTDRRVAIIGGGAAGLMAAATLAEAGHGGAVTLYERNPRLGAKVIISGGGRCNVTTGVDDLSRVLAAYPRGGRWLRHAMHAFPPAAVRHWFEDHGVPLKTEADGRVFPVSDNGRDIVAVFSRLFAAHGVEARLRAAVTAITANAATAPSSRNLAPPPTSADSDVDERPTSAAITPEHPRFVVETADGRERYAAVLITTGGAAFSHTGSRGDGYRFAAALGHTVTPLFPSLNAYVVQEPWAHALAGVSLTDAEVSIPARQPGGAAYRFRGPLLFTHVGVTGPAIFALGALAATEPFDAAHPLPLRLRLLPDHNEQTADALLQARFAALGGREVVNVLDTLLPRSLCPVVCAVAGVEPTTRAARVARAERQALARALTALPLTVSGRRNGEEFVTAGGVDTAEIDPRTMASRRVPGLCFAGEVLNVDGFTGGYNLQAAWATGRLAGQTVARLLEPT